MSLKLNEENILEESPVEQGVKDAARLTLGPILACFGLSLVSVAIGGGVLLAIAGFAHYPLSFRMACAISLLISYVAIRNTNLTTPEHQGITKVLTKWALELVASGVFVALIGLCTLVFGALK